MARYGSYSRVEGLTSYTFDVTNKPTQTDINNALDERSAEADAAMQMGGWATPLDETANPISWKLVQGKVCRIVALDADQTLSFGKRESSDNPKRVGNWLTEWQDFIAAISGFNKDGSKYMGRRLILPDADMLDPSAAMPESYGSVHDGDSDVEPRFTVEDDF